MTERKSTEIKIRATPSFKARVQSAADASEADSLTEWLEQAAEERIWADENRKLDGTALLGNSIATIVGSPCGDCGEVLPPHTSHCGTCKSFPRWSDKTHPAKSWMYEGQTPPERRTEPCSHSKPPYAFCAECDR